MAHRRRVEIKEADQDFANNACADGSESVPRAPDISLAQDVIPERRLSAPPCLNGTDFITGQWRFAETTGDCLAGGKTDALSALQIAEGQRVELFNFGRARQRDRQRDQRADQTPVNFLCARRPSLSNRQVHST